MPRGAAKVLCMAYADPKLSLRPWCDAERIMTSWRPGGDGGGSLVGSGWNSGTVVIRCTWRQVQVPSVRRRNLSTRCQTQEVLARCTHSRFLL